MSKSLIIISALIFVGIASLNSYRSFETSKPKYRRPAQILKTGKTLDVTITSNQENFKNTDVVTLTAQIKLLRDSEAPIEFEWELPEGVTLLKGPIEDVIYNATPERLYEVSIQVSGIDSEIRKNIHLTTTVNFQNIKIGSTTVFSTKPDEIFLKTKDKNGNDELLSLTKQEVPPPEDIHR